MAFIMYLSTGQRWKSFQFRRKWRSRYIFELSQDQPEQRHQRLCETKYISCVLYTWYRTVSCVLRSPILELSYARRSGRKRGKHLIQSDNQRRRQGSEMWWKSNLKKTNFEKDKSEKDKSGGNPQLFHVSKSGKHHTTGRSRNIGDNHRWEFEERVALVHWYKHWYTDTNTGALVHWYSTKQQDSCTVLKSVYMDTWIVRLK